MARPKMLRESISDDDSLEGIIDTKTVSFNYRKDSEGKGASMLANVAFKSSVEVEELPNDVSGPDWLLVSNRGTSRFWRWLLLKIFVSLLKLMDIAKLLNRVVQVGYSSIDMSFHGGVDFCCVEEDFVK